MIREEAVELQQWHSSITDDKSLNFVPYILLTLNVFFITSVNIIEQCLFYSLVCHQLLEVCILIGDLDTSILVNTWKVLKK